RSTHLGGLVNWRLENLKAAAAGRTYDVPVPFAEHALQQEGGNGSPCGLGDPGFTSWTCNEGLRCEDANGDVLGTCGAATARPIGNICETAHVSLDADSHKDRRTDVQQLPCDTGLRCVNLGAPGGQCRSDCSFDKVGTMSGGVVCGIVAKKVPTLKCVEQDL